jgi:hypothetical protein
MDRVILLQFGESVNEQFELVGMRPHVLIFENLPSFNELVARVRAVMNTGCDLSLHDRYYMGGGQQTDLYDATFRVRCGRGDRRRSTFIMRWTIWRRVTIMICMVRVTSIK